MTIAIGLLAKDGVVLAADRQANYVGYKAEAGKLSAVQHGAETREAMGACGVTGSTDRAPFLHTLQQHIAHDFMTSQDEHDPAVMERRFGNIVEDFAARHLAPYASHGEIDLIIGYQRAIKFALWSTHLGTIRRHAKYAAVGAGSPQALTLLDRLWVPAFYDVCAASALAVYVLWNVKEVCESCGKFTDVAFITWGERVWIPRPIVTELERLFGAYVSLSEPDVVRHLLGLTFPVQIVGKPLPQRLDELQEQIVAQVEKIRALSPREKAKHARAAAATPEEKRSRSPKRARKDQPPPDD